MTKKASSHFFRAAIFGTVLFAITVLTQGCSSVKAWERGNLARPEMAFSPDPLQSKIQNHVYHSKEASQSVASGAGGGCGCN